MDRRRRFWSASVAGNSDAGDYFGYAVALDRVGARLLVGAPYEASRSALDPTDDTAPHAGAVYELVRTDTEWASRTLYKAPNAEMGDELGCAVAVAEPGHAVLIGANLESSGATGVGGDLFDESSPSAGAGYLWSE